MADMDHLLGVPLTRRTALGSTAALTSSTLISDGDASVPAPPAKPVGIRLAIRTTVNGKSIPVEIDVRTSLLDLLREQLHLTGAKKGCDHVQCGACTVHVNGRRVASCLTLAAKVDGRAVTTIEGLADGETLHPM